VTFEGHFRDLITAVTLRAQLTRDLLATTEFLVSKCKRTVLLHAELLEYYVY